MNTYRIGEIARKLALSVDTLRYYEKIGLLPCVARDAARVRFYTDKDISRLRFIRRTQKMNFSLREIGQLLQFRENPQGARPVVRQMAQKKLADVEQQVEELQTLRDELRLLINLCGSSTEGCPIIQDISQKSQSD